MKVKIYSVGAGLLCGLFFLSGTVKVSGQPLNFIYKKGEAGYACFRIPAIVTTTKGTVLAFAEARKNNCGDAGDIDLVVKRSSDNGRTWSPLEVVWNDSSNTCGNPSPVVDTRTGHIVLLSTWNLGTDHEKEIIGGTSKNGRRVFVIISSDDGNSWSKAKEITDKVKKENWTWYATGPGSAVQISRGKYKGRLVVGCNHVEAITKKNYVHAIYSDDGGQTWTLGGVTAQDQVNESSVAELPNGKLMVNMRNAGKMRNRQVSTSKDGGISWSDIHADSTLIEPVCEGSLIQYHFPGRKTCMVFSNPASKTARVNMTVRLSFNKGKTWPLKKILYAGPSAYSDLTVLPDGNLGCYFEAGYAGAYEGIVFEEVSLADFVKDTE